MNQYKYWKIIFDFILAITLTVFLIPLLIILFIIASLDTSSNGLFFQKRIGQYGKNFIIFKFKTIHEKNRSCSKIGKTLRKFKLDELTQLLNIIKGDMSFVGPRPDIEGYYDRLEGYERKILELKPGLTSEASIKYSNEDVLLRSKENPQSYNDEVIFPDKVKMNLDYLENISFKEDLRILWKTFFKIIK
ncbi:sugar transferase [Chryseobacterium polytrichastri]|uniref:Sugar transferase involved in LPS biosynthesis (Colanic, teichoic acid) n=1 Tax=Chryseobacterium polytrichastri TaxID=1302687 RepID=A0A1M6U2T9_9FLAO|nr:sugar transferase [Chryseobacterium polytrichastri]SHK63575.1 Sugar transferase involved in LPS biosynthesis (colanic, teichoic acid) [Chryseobacterium polytrichastri]